MKARFLTVCVLCLLQLDCFTADYNGSIRNVEQRIFDLRRQIQQLASEKERTLDELRRGLFCSECSRSKSEIERAGIPFQKHLQDVKGHSVAKPELIARKAAEFDRKIMALQQQITGLEQEKSQLADASRREMERQRQETIAERARQQQEAAQAAELRAQRERQRIVDQAEQKVQNLNTMRDGWNKSIEELGKAMQPPKDDKSRVPSRQGDEPPSDSPEIDNGRSVQSLPERLEYPANGTIEEKVAYWDRWIPAVQERMELMHAADRMAQRAEIFESGAQDIRRYTEEGVNNASLSQIGAFGRATEGAVQVYAEFQPPQVNAAYNAAVGSAKVLWESSQQHVAKTPNELLKDGVDLAKIPVNVDKALTPQPTWDTKWSGKALNGVGVYINTKDGEYAAALSDGASVLGWKRLEVGASLVDGGWKLYDGARGIYEGAQLKQHLRTYAAPSQNGFLDKAAWLRQQEEELRRRVAELDRVLLPPRP